MAKNNIVDKLADDNTTIQIKQKSLKWLIGVIISCFLFIFGQNYFSNDSLEAKMIQGDKAINERLDKLIEQDVKDNTKTNNKQDVDIGRLYERTNSRESVNRNTERPTNTNLPPNF